jgi:hypothetical protein
LGSGDVVDSGGIVVEATRVAEVTGTLVTEQVARSWVFGRADIVLAMGEAALLAILAVSVLTELPARLALLAARLTAGRAGIIVTMTETALVAELAVAITEGETSVVAAATAATTVATTGTTAATTAAAAATAATAATEDLTVVTFTVVETALVAELTVSGVTE